jgi:hypothetical protein
MRDDRRTRVGAEYEYDDPTFATPEDAAPRRRPRRTPPPDPQNDPQRGAETSQEPGMSQDVMPGPDDLSAP